MLKYKCLCGSADKVHRQCKAEEHGPLGPLAGSEARERVALANADYEDRRSSDRSHRFNMRTIEREWKLKPGQLQYYRANKARRKDSGVTVTFGRSSQNDQADAPR